MNFVEWIGCEDSNKEKDSFVRSIVLIESLSFFHRMAHSFIHLRLYTYERVVLDLLFSLSISPWFFLSPMATTPNLNEEQVFLATLQECLQADNDKRSAAEVRL